MLRKKISIDVEDLKQWEAVASTLHYGTKGKYKLLRKLLAHAMLNPLPFINK